MHAAAIAVAVLAALVLVPALWARLRAPRVGKHLTPMIVGSGQLIRFRPGARVLRDHDADDIAQRPAPAASIR